MTIKLTKTETNKQDKSRGEFIYIYIY